MPHLVLDMPPSVIDMHHIEADAWHIEADRHHIEIGAGYIDPDMPSNACNTQQLEADMPLYVKVKVQILLVNRQIL